MNVASSQSTPGEALQGLLKDPWGASTGGAAASAGPQGAADVAAPPDSGGVTACFQSANPAAFTGLQTANSFAQAASGHIGRLRELLQGMGGLSSQASGEAARGFRAGQEALRGIVGGSAEEIGGGASPGATFGGSGLFGPSGGGATIATGLASHPSIILGGKDLNLRTGAVLSLIRQDPSGAFEMEASDPGASEAVSAAAQQVDSAADAVDRTQAMVEIASAEARVGEENVTSAVFAPSDAVEASRSAASAIIGLRGAAVAAHSRLASQPSTGLLQADQA